MKHLPFFLLTGFFLYFLFFVLAHGFSSLNVLLTTGFLLICCLFGVFTLWPNRDDKKFARVDQLNLVSASIVGAVFTYFLTQQFGITPVLSASLAGLIGYGAAQVLLKYKVTDIAPVFYCGSFVGMASAKVLPYEGVFLAGTIAGILFVYLCNVFNGCGGKLGSIAFVSCLLTISGMFLLRFAI